MIHATLPLPLKKHFQEQNILCHMYQIHVRGYFIIYVNFLYRSSWNSQSKGQFFCSIRENSVFCKLNLITLD